MIITGMRHFENVCQKKLVEWYNRNQPQKIDLSDVFIVWSCKTLQNYKCLASTTVSGDWIVATEENTPLLGGEATFGFDAAIKYLKRGIRVKRKGWNGKQQYIELAERISYTNQNAEIINPEHKDMGNRAIAFVGTSGVQLGWLASQADMLAEDWVFV